MDNFRIIYRILHYLERAMDYDEPDLSQISAEKFSLTEQRWTAIMEMLAREKYVDGISVKRSADGEAVLSISTPRITLRGLEYLQENSMMKKAANLVRGVAEFIP